MVVHPINPPYLIPAVEVVPAPWTDPRRVERTAAFLRAAGHAPIVMKREIDGFVMNRMQGALLEEAFRLVAEGYVSARGRRCRHSRGAGPALVVHGAVRNPSTSTRRPACATTSIATSRSNEAIFPTVAVAGGIGAGPVLDNGRGGPSGENPCRGARWPSASAGATAVGWRSPPTSGAREAKSET